MKHHEKKLKMNLSGDSFEILVKEKISSLSSVPVACRCNYRFYSSTLGTGRETDILVVKPQAIYCVECKNYRGTVKNPSFIKGREFNEDWVFKSSGKVRTVENPYMLNKRRIRVLLGLLRKNKYPLFDVKNVICVPDVCKNYTNLESVMTLSELIFRLSREDSLGESTLESYSRYCVKPSQLGIQYTAKLLDRLVYKIGK